MVALISISKDFKISKIGKEIKKLNGIDHSEMIGDSILSYIHENDLHTFATYCTALSQEINKTESTTIKLKTSKNTFRDLCIELNHQNEYLNGHIKGDEFVKNDEEKKISKPYRSKLIWLKNKEIKTYTEFRKTV